MLKVNFTRYQVQLPSRISKLYYLSWYNLLGAIVSPTRYIVKSARLVLYNTPSTTRPLFKFARLP